MPILRWAFLSALSGLLAGTSSALFLIGLDHVTNTRILHPWLLWLLPLAGFATAASYQLWGKDSARGHGLILDEIHDPKSTLPARMAPLILISTWLTHLCGGSAGREGTAVQMGASLTDQLSRVFKIEPQERRVLLCAGMGAAFGSAIGAPWAGVIFGMEVISVGPLRLFAIFQCAIASWVATWTADSLGAKHSTFAAPDFLAFSPKDLLIAALAGIAFGLAAALFVRLAHLYEKGLKRLLPNPLLQPTIVGAVLALLLWTEGNSRFAGLGIPEIQRALQAPARFDVPALKAFFTILTVGSGFKGGEFVPIVFVGTTLGSALSAVLPASFQLLGALGFAAMFAAASNTPVACSIMACELFGPRIAPYAAVACFVAYYCSGYPGLYKAQRLHAPKLPPFRGIRDLMRLSRRSFPDRRSS